MYASETEIAHGQVSTICKEIQCKAMILKETHVLLNF